MQGFALELDALGQVLRYHYDGQQEHSGIAELLRTLDEAGIEFGDLQSSQSSLEEIFVNLLRESA